MPRSCTDIDNDLMMAGLQLASLNADKSYYNAAISAATAAILAEEGLKSSAISSLVLTQTAIDAKQALIDALNAERTAAGC